MESVFARNALIMPKDEALEKLRISKENVAHRWAYEMMGEKMLLGRRRGRGRRVAASRGEAGAADERGTAAVAASTALSETSIVACIE